MCKVESSCQVFFSYSFHIKWLRCCCYSHVEYKRENYFLAGRILFTLKTTMICMRTFVRVLSITSSKTQQPCWLVLIFPFTEGEKKIIKIFVTFREIIYEYEPRKKTPSQRTNLGRKHRPLTKWEILQRRRENDFIHNSAIWLSVMKGNICIIW